MQVLKSLRYLDDQSRVQLKGRVACEISTHELMITEMVFQNVVSDLEPAEIVALLSCFVFQQVLCDNCSHPSTSSCFIFLEKMLGTESY